MSSTPIAQQVTQLRRRIAPAADAPPNAYLIEQAALHAAGLLRGLASAGSVLPDAALLDPAGNTTSLYAAVW